MRGDGTMDNYIEDLKNYLLNLIQEVQNIRALKMAIKCLEHARHKTD